MRDLFPALQFHFLESYLVSKLPSCRNLHNIGNILSGSSDKHRSGPIVSTSLKVSLDVVQRTTGFRCLKGRESTSVNSWWKWYITRVFMNRVQAGESKRNLRIEQSLVWMLTTIWKCGFLWVTKRGHFLPTWFQTNPGKSFLSLELSWLSLPPTLSHYPLV